MFLVRVMLLCLHPSFESLPEWLNGTNASRHIEEGEGGCPSNLQWCFELPQIHLAQLLMATFFLAIGYPTTNLLTSTLYSKVLGSRPQVTPFPCSFLKFIFLFWFSFPKLRVYFSYENNLSCQIVIEKLIERKVSVSSSC